MTPTAGADGALGANALQRLLDGHKKTDPSDQPVVRIRHTVEAGRFDGRAFTINGSAITPADWTTKLRAAADIYVGQAREQWDRPTPLPDDDDRVGQAARSAVLGRWDDFEVVYAGARAALGQMKLWLQSERVTMGDPRARTTDRINAFTWASSAYDEVSDAIRAVDGAGPPTWLMR